MKRKIYTDFIKWKNNIINKKPLMVLGVRQCGKTYIIKEFCKNEFDNYKFVNLLSDKNIINLYKSDKTSQQKFNELKILLNFDFEMQNSVLFIDEIQECEELITELKYFCEEHNNVNIICAGSLLGVKLSKMKQSHPVGKVQRLYLYPMDFEEFLLALNQEKLINRIKECFINNESMGILHSVALDFYKKYLICGGMPESVASFVNNYDNLIKYDTNILKDIIEGYRGDMGKHVESEYESLRIINTYNSLAAQLMNASKKFQFSKIEEGGRARTHLIPLVWLENSNLTQLCKNVKQPEIPISTFVDNDTFKAFYSDVGLLNSLVGVSMKNILEDDLKIFKGIITENYVANQLKSQGIDLYYWKGNRDAEVDFLITSDKYGVVPIEVKSDDHTQSKSLKIYYDQYKPNLMLRISSKDFGYNPLNNLKSIPLYATFLIKELL